ncbi:hypothetical protein N7478_001834 [Penicillium angulare]|uniref:uncharacterized protein n=1 Tax=Penicillium angulare TaxID=116970 RepID=UPI00253FE2CA|nr:uncharacterized protein N7478_001834 [Penicillium angulare]KAJ5288804.1 hypothetical protein N7478_001834 [Penicillium angulare]
MESVRQSCRPKHQVLTLKCYPRYQKGVAEVRPNPSELSYLLYYASTRRSKLTKVGGFLEKKVAKDVWRRRLGNVQVALHILTALIEKVPRDLPIYALYVLTVIETVLRSNEVSMVEDSIATFETFCRHQEIATIAAEQGIAQKYREVVRLYASFADPSSESYSPTKVSPPVAIRWRNAGLRAIKSVVSSDGLSADGGTSLKIILPVILENLYSKDEDVLIPLRAKLQDTKDGDNDPARPRRMSVTTVNTVDTVEADPALAAGTAADVDRKAEMDARFLALRCLEQIIVSGSNRGQMRIAASIILKFISKKQFPRSSTRDQSVGEGRGGNWATSLIELVANWCPVQIRFVILMTAMDILLDTSPKEKDLDSAFTILSVVDWLLKSSVNMIGLSVMDILHGLIHYAPKILSPHEDTEAEKKTENQPESTLFVSDRRKSLLALLEQCIGNLATHIYYGDQVADMTRAILRRFKPSVNQDSAAPSTLATVHESTASPVAPTQSVSEANGDKAHGETYSHAAAKVTALRAVKAIFVVANSKKSSSESETRNVVGIHVWEGTQLLLRDGDRDVRYAYAEALLSWLRLETNKDDLKVRNDAPKYVKPASKREPEHTDKLNRRSTSAPGNQREMVSLAAQSIFLRLLHLAIYDSALEAASAESEILLLHLLLVSLVENLGVNAVQFGLPMVLKLQDELFTSVDLGSSNARVNVASLVHGYLLAVSEKFELGSSHAGVEIRNEVERRQSKRQWLSHVRLPPLVVHDLIADIEKSAEYESVSSDSLTPFRNVEGLVSEIDESYRKSISSPPQSPPTSPARGFNFPVLSQPPTSQPQLDSGLPSPAKEHMLSSWSRESCLAAVEKESARTLSLSGSRGGTMSRNNNTNSNANGSPAGSATQKNRRMSVHEVIRTPEYSSSSRGSPVRVTELRRVLSVNNDSQQRKLSPLRGHVDLSNVSVVSSSSESMISDHFPASEMDPDSSSIHQQDSNHNGDGSETPRPASYIALTGDRTTVEQSNGLGRVNSEEIPPVPPIPANLSIPGTFPNDSQRSLLIERPSTAPDSRQSNGDQNQMHARNKSLNRNKSRSSNSLAAGTSGAYHDANGDSALDNSQRDQLKQLLDGFLAPENSLLTNGDRPSTATKTPLNRSYSSRRHVSGGGIGRPPY